MSLLSAHLEQIGYSCQGIDSLPFPQPKIFTNALLSSHDITSLIRDTEPHERALFSVPPPPPPPTSLKPAEAEPPKKKRRQTVFNVASGEVTTGPPTRTGAAHNPRRHTAVAAVLGAPMHEKLRRGEQDRKGDVDVDVLLQGAEKLCGVYELPGARERIAVLRSKYAHGKNTMAYFEAKVSEQAEQLASLNRDWMDEGDDEDEEEELDEGEAEWTEEDLKREEEEARGMEAKKRDLQARLRQMERDLGGLRNM
ncbi:DASH complex subunit Spc34 [Mariannaea sp. PMI_226]|nr:DASH complex subunit Spc34 [Mariannaea sp. PMI_226]